jgi:hypothetical protein
MDRDDHIEALTDLRGIGEKRAEAIIDILEERGAFDGDGLPDHVDIDEALLHVREAKAHVDGMSARTANDRSHRNSASDHMMRTIKALKHS